MDRSILVVHIVRNFDHRSLSFTSSETLISDPIFVLFPNPSSTFQIFLNHHLLSLHRTHQLRTKASRRPKPNVIHMLVTELTPIPPSRTRKPNPNPTFFLTLIPKIQNPIETSFPYPHYQLAQKTQNKPIAFEIFITTVSLHLLSPQIITQT